MSHLADRLRRWYDPLTLPAPFGRSPDGWPLVGCCQCERPIPWSRRGGRPDSPKIYYSRKFCSEACRYHADGDPARAARMRAPVPALLDPWNQIQLPTGPAFKQALPAMDEILQCGKCGSAAFRQTAVGKACINCGKLNLARDGDWARESVLAHTG